MRELRCRSVRVSPPEKPFARGLADREPQWWRALSFFRLFLFLRPHEPFFARISHCLMERVKSPALGGKAKGYYETIDRGSGCSGHPRWAGISSESEQDGTGSAD